VADAHKAHIVSSAEDCHLTSKLHPEHVGNTARSPCEHWGMLASVQLLLFQSRHGLFRMNVKLMNFGHMMSDRKQEITTNEKVFTNLFNSEEIGRGT